ncbi:MAG TPA: SWIM zinc finger family protein [Pirellulaceae bacterium]|nr:SWIM zinc finger family protein [Pirellulaceae bacterium]
MITIDDAYVDAAAPNAEAGKNGRALILKGKFKKLCISPDETLLFGECQGSGASPYQCSCDFLRPESPTHRCSCPSRQFPCKHCLGLMYAYAQKKGFATADVPAALAEKREKLSVRVEKKKEEQNTPKQVDKVALAKKIKAQLAGLDLLETLTHDLVRLGMGTMNAKTARQIEEQAKQLGNAYLPGAQATLHIYTKLFSGDEGKFDADVPAAKREAVYSEALDQLTRLHALVKQGRTYLNKRLEDPELPPETESAIAAWLGHAWQLRELREAQRVESNAELMQLAFNSYDDVARGEYVDTGIWMNLSTGRIQFTQNFRPYKAAKYIKSDDSFFQIAQVKELCVYPGGVNPRIRWDEMLPRPVEPADYAKIRQHADSDFAALIKEVKGQFKGPLADKRPVCAINYARIGKVGNELVVEDTKQQRLVMTERGIAEEPPSCNLFYLLPQALFAKQTLVARFHHDLDTRQLRIKPLAIVTSDAIVRLTY